MRHSLSGDEIGSRDSPPLLPFLSLSLVFPSFLPQTAFCQTANDLMPSVSTILLVSTGIASLASGLQIMVMDIPNPVAVGDSLELMCSFDLEGDSLYSVKFYKNS